MEGCKGAGRARGPSSAKTGKVVALVPDIFLGLEASPSEGLALVPAYWSHKTPKKCPLFAYVNSSESFRCDQKSLE